jgi:hypothetical protein
MNRILRTYLWKFYFRTYFSILEGIQFGIKRSADDFTIAPVSRITFTGFNSVPAVLFIYFQNKEMNYEK